MCACIYIYYYYYYYTEPRTRRSHVWCWLVALYRYLPPRSDILLFDGRVLRAKLTYRISRRRILTTSSIPIRCCACVYIYIYTTLSPLVYNTYNIIYARKFLSQHGAVGAGRRRATIYGGLTGELVLRNTLHAHRSRPKTSLPARGSNTVPCYHRPATPSDRHSRPSGPAGIVTPEMSVAVVVNAV